MAKSLRVVIMIFLFTQCKPSLQTISGTFKNEAYQYRLQSGSKTTNQIIYIPDLPYSIIDETEVFKIGKGEKVLLPYLSNDNALRQKQLDNLQNRKDYYSELLQQLIVDSTSHVTIVAEGLNANLISHIAFAYPIDHIVLINPFKPDIEQCFISNCFNAGNTTTCDSLLQHFQLNNLVELEKLLQNLQENNIDEQLGLYTLSFWNDIYRYTCNPRSNKYERKLSYIYTSNSGLALPQDSINTINVHGFYKRLKKVINN
jgi:hypothetical protein